MKTAIDLFSGCGGLTLGLKQAGFRVLAAIEVEPLAVETYELNHPEVIVKLADICSVNPADLRAELGLEPGDLDLLSGCPPCQGFSTIKTLNGGKEISDSRNDLIFQFLDFVEEFKPKAVMMENVPGLAKDSRMILFSKRLDELGYPHEIRILNAGDYGVPQRRRRMILLGAESVEIPFAPESSVKITVRDAIGLMPLAGQSGDPLHDFTEKRGRRVLEFIAKVPKDGGSRRDVGADHQLVCHKNSNGFKDVYGRMAWNDVAPTITGGCVNPSKGRFLHPEFNRSITLREAALLQSFPPDYKFSVSRGKYAIAEMIGNALPPEFVRQHARSVWESICTVHP